MHRIYYTIIIFRDRFATDFTGEINNHIFKQEGIGGILVDVKNVS